MTTKFEILRQLLVCPVTGLGDLELLGDAQDGLLVSGADTCYPIIGGVPRMLPPDLLGPFLKGAFPDVLERWPQLDAFVSDTVDAEPDVLDTLVAYSYQHVDLADDELLRDDWLATWHRFQPGVELSHFRGKSVLEIGSGEGRHGCLVGEQAELYVGLDLSRGVELANRRDVNSNSFYVQGDLRRPPFGPGAFDALYSNGVLHHTPEPQVSFRSVAPLVRDGGEVFVWVYGLDDMRWSYRVSHLTFLRPMTNRLPRIGQLGMAFGLTAAVEVALWTPTRVLRHAGLPQLAEKIPYADAASRDWTYKLRRMFDRINPPITHYISREELFEWFAELEHVEVLNADGQGWSARGRVRSAVG